LRKSSIASGLLIGFIAGLAGSAAKAVGEWVYEPRTPGQTPPPVVLAQKLAGHSLSKPAQKIAMQGIHYGFGAITGAAYGAAAAVFPKVTTGYGSLFGVTLQLLTHESLVPAAGLDVPALRQPLREHTSEFFTHIVYGVTTEAVRRGLHQLTRR
jgi:putative membrane protein